MMSYQRYLEVKRSIDDRSLNQGVFRCLLDHLSDLNRPRVLEIGSGIGTMVARGIEWGLLKRAEYTAVDRDLDNLAYTHHYLGHWAGENGYFVEYKGPQSIILTKGDKEVTVLLNGADAIDLIKSGGSERWDLLIAHLFLDLVDITQNLPPWIRLLRPGGTFYLSLVLDGPTILRPVIDKGLDELLVRAYHQKMDRKLPIGSPYRSSETGRQALDLLLTMNDVEIIEVGSSDWIICPRHHRYTQEELDFLEFIIQTISEALKEEGAVDGVRLGDWISKRREQLQDGKLIYMSHQIDIVGSLHGLGAGRGCD